MAEFRLSDTSKQPVANLDNSSLNENHEENKTQVAPDTSVNTRVPPRLCPACSRLLLNPNVCRKLAEPDQAEPYRIQHYNISRLMKSAAKGCGLCSILYHEASEVKDGNMGSYFEICPTPTPGLRSEIVWAAALRDKSNVPIHRVSLYYFTETDSPLSTLIPSRPVLGSVTNEQASRRIERAFSQCLSQHDDCPRSEVNILPSRVIDVETMRLHETGGHETGSYVALSYCWGGDQKIKTTTGNITSKKLGIDFDGLPQTLQDSILVCRQVAIRYLWIDALCIIQDNDDDKIRELTQMAQIYNRATLVISASRAKSVHDGFLADIEVHSEKAVMLPARFSPTCKGKIGIIEVPDEISGLEPINQRGWTYQEIGLASRALIYTDGGIIWQCDALWDRLAYDGIQTDSHPSADMVLPTREFKVGPLQPTNWDQSVRIYTMRNLTSVDDRLEAIAGIATIAASKWNSNYYAGLWENDIESQLGWRVDLSAFEYEWKWRKPLSPSWSWASVDAPVCDVVRFVRSETTRGVKFISCEVKLAHSENPLGRVLSGRLTVEAFLVEAQYAEPSWLADTCMDSNGESVDEDELDGMWCLVLGCAPDNGIMDSIPQWDGLLLTSLPDGTFQRLGVFRQDLEPDSSDVDDDELDDYFADLEAKNAIGPEASFPTQGSRRKVVIV